MATNNTLGRGTTGVVEEVFINGKRVARKNFNSKSYYDHEREIYERIRDIQPFNIVQLLAAGPRYLDLELVQGGSMFDLMHNQVKSSSLTPDDVSGILIGCTRALDYFHKVIKKAHFDIKPANILLTDTNLPKICDFGHSMDPTNVKHLQGTHEYMPPELFHGKNTNYTVDIYSLGISMFHFVCRRHPFLSTEDWDNPNRSDILKEATKHNITVDRPKIAISQTIKNIIRGMAEPNLSLRPDAARVLELLEFEGG